MRLTRYRYGAGGPARCEINNLLRQVTFASATEEVAQHVQQADEHWRHCAHDESAPTSPRGRAILRLGTATLASLALLASVSSAWVEPHPGAIRQLDQNRALVENFLLNAPLAALVGAEKSDTGISFSAGALMQPVRLREWLGAIAADEAFCEVNVRMAIRISRYASLFDIASCL